jgi:hypothetical protein
VQNVPCTSGTRKEVSVVKRFTVTLRNTLTPAEEQRFADVIRARYDVDTVEPIIEMGTPMKPEKVAELGGIVEAVMAVETDPKILRLGAYMKELLVEVDRARQAELISSRALVVAGKTRKELETMISVLEQRLAQLGEGDRR